MKDNLSLDEKRRLVRAHNDFMEHLNSRRPLTFRTPPRRPAFVINTPELKIAFDRETVVAALDMYLSSKRVSR